MIEKFRVIVLHLAYFKHFRVFGLILLKLLPNSVILLSGIMNTGVNVILKLYLDYENLY